jgi:pyruvate,water dikinase
MNKNSALVLPFKEITKEDTAVVGGKGANLGEMVQVGLPIPQGFCLTSNAYRLLLSENHLDQLIKDTLKDLDVKDTKALDAASKKIKDKFLKADIPQEVVKEVFNLYRHLKKGNSNPLVAVRSSATAEDLPDASFAGQQDSFLNIQGEANLIQAIRSAYASLFGARAIFYRETKGYDHFKVSLAIPVQLMIQSEVSGVMFSINPVTNNKQQIVIEAVWGLGDYIVQGVVTPDHYVVNKTDFSIHSRLISQQTVMEVSKNPTSQRS